MRAMGLMSGTSMDGIDVALIETDGERVVTRVASATYAYDVELKARLAVAVAEARDLAGRSERPGSLREIERLLSERNAEAVERFFVDQAIERTSIDVIGYHGQTVLHRPPSVAVLTTAAGVPYDEKHVGMTVQLGDGELLAKLTGLRVVYDLRADDVAAGGQGAPLAPIYHAALVSGLPQRPVAVVNIGGVANVTFVGRDGQLLAFDTGPGSALIDDHMLATTGLHCDEDGATAARGTPDASVVKQLLSDVYFTLVPPKSLDRDAFSRDPVSGLGLEDAIATLTSFSAKAIARSREVLPEEPLLWILTGGGRHNRTLARMVAESVENAVVPAEAAGFDGDSVEAEAWAYLAVRSLAGLPITFPGTTGVAAPLTGGVLATPDRS
ncbi:MAG: anhydro-N-acetylmuramic acid kinase [Alphaproteobacteria bacterium]|nr:anhydro-N-acetylmuramic acid kinase [Alphaproteobacteria bacterium]